MKIAEVAEHLFGICHVLVDVVEIGQQQLSPGVEVVERLCGAGAVGERFVQIADELDRVGHFEGGVLTKKITDGDICRAPHRLSGRLHECLVEKECRPLVGKNNGGARQICTPLANYVFCDIFQKRFCLRLHYFTSSILLVYTYQRYPLTFFSPILVTRSMYCLTCR